MTVVDDRIAMADANTKRLDEWFERLERIPVPEGFRVEIVEGNVHMSPQRDTHWGPMRTSSRAEVISRGTAANDYGPEKTAYALAEVPVHLIADRIRASAVSTSAPRATTTGSRRRSPSETTWISPTPSSASPSSPTTSPATDAPEGYAAASSSRSRGTKRTRGWPPCQPTVNRRSPTRARTRPIVTAAAAETTPPSAKPTRAP